MEEASSINKLKPTSPISFQHVFAFVNRQQHTQVSTYGYDFRKYWTGSNLLWEESFFGWGLIYSHLENSKLYFITTEMTVLQNGWNIPRCSSTVCEYIKQQSRIKTKPSPKCHCFSCWCDMNSSKQLVDHLYTTGEQNKKEKENY